MSRKLYLIAAAILLAAPFSAVAEEHPAILDVAKAGEDYAVQGEYEGLFEIDGNENKFGLQIIAWGDGQFHGVAYLGGLPGDGWDTFNKLEADGQREDEAVVFRAAEGSLTIKDGVATVRDQDDQELGTLDKVTRTSPTLGAACPEGGIVLFDGTSVDAWMGAKLTDDGLLAVPLPHAVTKQKFRDFKLHVEFRTPYMPTARGQARGNCGVFLGGRYEIQVLDSFGLEGRDNECGALYSLAAPEVNACAPPLTWQTYDVEFTAPRFDDDGTKTDNAVATVVHNGILVHDAVELTHASPGGIPESNEPGPILLHFHGNPVHFRNIWIVETPPSD